MMTCCHDTPVSCQSNCCSYSGNLLCGLEVGTVPLYTSVVLIYKIEVLAYSGLLALIQLEELIF